MTSESIIVEAKDFVTTNGITAGWSQAQHVSFVAGVLIGLLGIERPEDKKELVSTLVLTCNPSAFRQVLEKAKVLGEVTKRATAEEIAEKLIKGI
jgi:hypothetical protein